MAAINNKNTITNYFRTGNIPTQNNYEDLIDSCFIYSDNTNTINVTREGNRTLVGVNISELKIPSSPSNAKINFVKGDKDIGDFTLNQPGGTTIVIPDQDGGCDGQIILRAKESSIPDKTYYACSGKDNIIELSEVAFSGSYKNLIDKPDIPSPEEFEQKQSDWKETDPTKVTYIVNKPNYDDGILHIYQNNRLVVFEDESTNFNEPFKPNTVTTIRYEILAPDWDEPENSQNGILNKPLLAKVATSGSYLDLFDKPNLPNDSLITIYRNKDKEYDYSFGNMGGNSAKVEALLKFIIKEIIVEDSGSRYEDGVEVDIVINYAGYERIEKAEIVLFNGRITEIYTTSTIEFNYEKTSIFAPHIEVRIPAPPNDGRQARARVITDGVVSGFVVVNGGLNYQSPPPVTIIGGNGDGATAVIDDTDMVGIGFGATATAIISGGKIIDIVVTNGGDGYTNIPLVTITDNYGSSATAIAKTNGITQINVTDQGNGYTFEPNVIITGGGGSGAIAISELSGDKVVGIKIIDCGSGYTSIPTVVISGGDGSGATAVSHIGINKVTGIYVTNQGNRYSNSTVVSINGGGSIGDVRLVSPGGNYSEPPTVYIGGVPIMFTLNQRNDDEFDLMLGLTALTNNYNDLDNKPVIGEGELFLIFNEKDLAAGNNFNANSEFPVTMKINAVTDIEFTGDISFNPPGPANPDFPGRQTIHVGPNGLITLPTQLVDINPETDDSVVNYFYDAVNKNISLGVVRGDFDNSVPVSDPYGQPFSVDKQGRVRRYNKRTYNLTLPNVIVIDDPGASRLSDVVVNETGKLGVGEVLNDKDIGIQLVLKPIQTQVVPNTPITYIYSETNPMFSFTVVDSITTDGKGRVTQYTTTARTIDLTCVVKDCEYDEFKNYTLDTLEDHENRLETLELIGGRWIGRDFNTLADLNAFDTTTVLPFINYGDYTYVVRDEDNLDAFGNPQISLYRWTDTGWAFAHVVQEDPVGKFTNTAFGFIKGDSERPGYVNAQPDGTGKVNCYPKVLDFDRETKNIWTDCKIPNGYCIFGFKKGAVSIPMDLQLQSSDVFSWKYLEDTTSVLNEVYEENNEEFPLWDKFYIYPCDSCSQPTIITTTLTVIRNLNNSVKINITGGPVKEWSIVSGVLPTGLTITNNGLIQGRPTGVASTTTVSVRACGDETCGCDTKNIDIIIEDIGITIGDRDWVVTMRWASNVSFDFDFNYTNTGTNPITTIRHSHPVSMFPVGDTTNFITVDRDDTSGYNTNGLSSWNPSSTWGETYSFKGSNIVDGTNILNKIAITNERHSSSDPFNNNFIFEMRVFRNIGDDIIALHKTKYWVCANNKNEIPSFYFKSNGGILPDNLFDLTDQNGSVCLSNIKPTMSNFASVSGLGSSDPPATMNYSMIELDLSRPKGVGQLIYIRQ